MDRWDTLTHECERILIGGLPESLKACLNRLHGRGYPHAAIMTMVRSACRKLGRQDTCFTALGCEAYLETLPPRQPRDCCGY